MDACASGREVQQLQLCCWMEQQQAQQEEVGWVVRAPPQVSGQV